MRQIGEFLAERRLVSDARIRAELRARNERTVSGYRDNSEVYARQKEDIIAAMHESSIALATLEANQQHYELPPEFFESVLGPRLKYSSCYWDGGEDSLEKAEERMLELTCERAGITDGQQILELGCGWGSLSLWMAEKFPRSNILAVTNSRLQKQHIDARVEKLGFDNVQIEHADINDFKTDQQFDRIVSIEMFEHVRNWRALLNRILAWTKVDGALFLHYFAHREIPFLFEIGGTGDWMARHFFTGGLMPSTDMAERTAEGWQVKDSWLVNGEHYTRTLNTWLEQMDAREAEIMTIMIDVYGKRLARIWLQRWRLFFIGCAEFFGARSGEEWLVTHVLLTPDS